SVVAVLLLLCGHARRPGPALFPYTTLFRSDGGDVTACAVLIATGAEYRRLPVEGLGDYEGWSVFYEAGQQEGHRCAAERVGVVRSEEHTSELQSLRHLECRLLPEKQTPDCN